MKHYFTLSRFLFLFLIMITFNGFAQMERPASLNHLALSVYDLKKSTDFYTDIIGIPLIPEPFKDGKHSWFKIGEHSQLHLIEDAKAITTHPKTNHLCFSVASMDSFIASLNKNNITFESAAGETKAVTTRPDGVKQVYFKDPDGYWIEINNDRY